MIELAPDGGGCGADRDGDGGVDVDDGVDVAVDYGVAGVAGVYVGVGVGRRWR